MTKLLKSKLAKMAKRLRAESREICAANGCNDCDHNCGSFAYFDVVLRNDEIVDVELCDICIPDYAQRVYGCAVMLPFYGFAADLFYFIKRETME